MPPAEAVADSQAEEIPNRSGAPGLLFTVMHLAIGLVALMLAGSEDFAAGKADFSNTSWRVVLGFIGATLTFLAARSVVRTLNSSETVKLTASLRHRARVNGLIVGDIGAFLFLAAVVTPLGDATISFQSWAKPFFAVGGIYLVLLALLIQWDPTKSIRRQRVEKGQGQPGTARILRANDTGTSVNDAPQVKIDFQISIGGRDYEASDKIVMQRAKLALLIPGSTVNVLVDRVDPNIFHIDWDSWKAPSQ
jgi:hypothetical protein